MINVFKRLEYLQKLNLEAKDHNMNSFDKQLRAKLSNEDLRQFEETHKIELPAEYTKFVLDYANGIDGNMLHVFPLEDFYALYRDEELLENYLKEDFPYSEKEVYYEIESDLRKETQGSITISDHGCGVYDLLVVSGKDRGSVWCDDRSSDNGIYRKASTFRKYLDMRIDSKMKNLVDQEIFYATLFKYPVLTKIIEVEGSGRGRDLKVLMKNQEYDVYHYQEDEFLEDGEISKILLPGFNERMVFIVDHATNFVEDKLNGVYRMDYLDEELRKEAFDSSKIKVQGRILESYRDGFSHKYYTRCEVDNFPEPLYIVTNYDISNLQDKECRFEGKLGSLIKGINI